MAYKTQIIIGHKGSGKTTAINTILKTLSDEKIECAGFKTYFDHEKTLQLKWINLDYLDITLGRKTSDSSLKPSLEALDMIGKRLIETDFNARIFIADEIGFLESLSHLMQDGIIKSIQTARHACYSMKAENYPFLSYLKNMGDVQITQLGDFNRENNEIVAARILHRFKNG